MRTAAAGWLRPEKVGRSTCWHLTEAARRLLTDGAERIYSFSGAVDDWDGRWLLVAGRIWSEGAWAEWQRLNGAASAGKPTARVRPRPLAGAGGMRMATAAVRPALAKHECNTNLAFLFLLALPSSPKLLAPIVRPAEEPENTNVTRI